MSGCTSNTNYNDEDLNIDRDDLSDTLVVEDNLNTPRESPYNFIALGDSYTIGEGEMRMKGGLINLLMLLMRKVSILINL